MPGIWLPPPSRHAASESQTGVTGLQVPPARHTFGGGKPANGSGSWMWPVLRVTALGQSPDFPPLTSMEAVVGVMLNLLLLSWSDVAAAVGLEEFTRTPPPTTWMSALDEALNALGTLPRSSAMI